MRALCIDDHPVNRQVLVALLATAGIVADEAACGRSGVAMVDAASYDIIFMDLRMPTMDGVEAAAKIRARDDDKSRTPIILVTADAGYSLESQNLSGQFDSTLFKPVRPDALFDAIARVLIAKGPQNAYVG